MMKCFAVYKKILLKNNSLYISVYYINKVISEQMVFIYGVIEQLILILLKKKLPEHKVIFSETIKCFLCCTNDEVFVCHIRSYYLNNSLYIFFILC